jgi:hypothetical protein
MHTRGCGRIGLGCIADRISELHGAKCGAICDAGDFRDRLSRLYGWGEAGFRVRLSIVEPRASVKRPIL